MLPRGDGARASAVLRDAAAPAEGDVFCGGGRRRGGRRVSGGGAGRALGRRRRRPRRIGRREQRRRGRRAPRCAGARVARRRRPTAGHRTSGVAVLKRRRVRGGERSGRAGARRPAGRGTGPGPSPAPRLVGREPRAGARRAPRAEARAAAPVLLPGDAGDAGGRRPGPSRRATASPSCTVDARGTRHGGGLGRFARLSASRAAGIREFRLG